MTVPKFSKDSFLRRVIFSFGFFLFFCFDLIEAKEIILANNGNDLKKAIEEAEPFDEIIINSGTYFFSEILIEKPLKISGEANSIIDGNGEGTIFIVKSDSVTIRNLTIQNTGISYIEDRSGIKVINSSNFLVQNCKLFNCLFGVYFQRSNNSKAIGNVILGNAKGELQSGNAVHIYYSKNIEILQNTISGHRDGIYIEFGSNSRFIQNICTQNIRYGLHFMFSDNNIFLENEFRKNGAGVAVMYSNKIGMKLNVFADNTSPVAKGILLKDIKNSEIERNNFSRNTTGIYAESVTNTLIAKNNFSQNGWALKILGNCEQNSILQNNFLANTFEVSTNSSLNRNNFDKNYWSNYTGYDINKDGFGDIPHSPVILFTYVTEQVPSSVVLMRSLFVDLLNLGEKIAPVITPATLIDESPKMKVYKW